jgi:hypothetical protein
MAADVLFCSERTIMDTLKDTFLDSYVECALWSSNDDDGNPLDSLRYADAELAEETRARMTKDCQAFELAANNLFAAAAYYEGAEQVAHDFWLTRNHHGAGFWDGDYPEPLGQQLTDLADSFGECDLYVGDDGKIYL